MGDRMVTVAIEYGSTLVLRCPDWCDGHPYAHVPLDPADVSHDSADTALEVATDRGACTILAAGFAWQPYSAIDRTPYLTVDLDTEGPVRLTAGQVHALADGLVVHAGVLHGLADRLGVLQAEAVAVMRPEGLPAHLPWPMPVPDDVEDGEL